jgi:hypothetical protein
MDVIPMVCGVVTAIAIGARLDDSTSLIAPLVPGLHTILRLLPNALSPHDVLAIDLVNKVSLV